MLSFIIGTVSLCLLSPSQANLDLSDSHSSLISSLTCWKKLSFRSPLLDLELLWLGPASSSGSLKTWLGPGWLTKFSTISSFPKIIAISNGEIWSLVFLASISAPWSTKTQIDSFYDADCSETTQHQNPTQPQKKLETQRLFA